MTTLVCLCVNFIRGHHVFEIKTQQSTSLLFMMIFERKIQLYLKDQKNHHILKTEPINQPKPKSDYCNINHLPQVASHSPPNLSYIRMIVRLVLGKQYCVAGCCVPRRLSRWTRKLGRTQRHEAELACMSSVK